MKESFYQKGLPDNLKKNTVMRKIHKNTFTYAWHYKEAKEVVEWLKLNNYIIDTIQVFKQPISGQVNISQPVDMEYSGYSWTYQGDRNKNKQENIDANLLNAQKFIDELHSKFADNFVYEICFTSENEMNEIIREFYYKSIIHSGFNFDVQEALEIIEKCQSIGK